MPTRTPDPNSSSRLERLAAKFERKGQEMKTRSTNGPTWDERLRAKAEELDARRLDDIRRRSDPNA